MLVMGATPDLYTWRAPSGRVPAYSPQQRCMRRDSDLGIGANRPILEVMETQRREHFRQVSRIADLGRSGGTFRPYTAALASCLGVYVAQQYKQHATRAPRVRYRRVGVAQLGKCISEFVNKSVVGFQGSPTSATIRNWGICDRLPGGRPCCWNAPSDRCQRHNKLSKLRPDFYRIFVLCSVRFSAPAGRFPETFLRTPVRAHMQTTNNATHGDWRSDDGRVACLLARTMSEKANTEIVPFQAAEAADPSSYW